MSLGMGPEPDVAFVVGVGALLAVFEPAPDFPEPLELSIGSWREFGEFELPGSFAGAFVDGLCG